VEQAPAVPRNHPPAWARAFVAVFLTAFVACGLGAGELWPLTRWHLFSAVRQPIQVGWRAVTVDAAGRETPLPVGQLPLAYRGAPLLVGRFDKLTPAEQASLCVRSLGRNVLALRIYRVRKDESIRVGARAAPEKVALRYTCAHGTVQAAGP